MHTSVEQCRTSDVNVMTPSLYSLHGVIIDAQLDSFCKSFLKKKMLSFRLKDKTGVVPMTVWGDEALALQHMAEGDFVQLTDVLTYANKPTLNNQASSAITVSS